MFVNKMAFDTSVMWIFPCCWTSLLIYIVSFIFITYTVSSRCRFYIKCVLLGLYYCILSIIFMFVVIPTPVSRNNFYKFAKLVKWVAKPWGIRYNVKGLENFKQDLNYIIVSNHQSSFDMNVVVNFIPPDTSFVSKKDAFYIPFIGIVYWLGGVMFIDRVNHDKAINTMKKAAEQIRKEKFNIWVFPEGTRHMGSKLLPFKKGSFHLAQQTQLPVLPIVISNYEHIFNFSERRFTTGTINITILPAIPTEGLEPSDVEQLTDNVYTIMSKEYERNCQER